MHWATKKFICLPLSWYSPYCSGLEANQQCLWGVPTLSREVDGKNGPLLYPQPFQDNVAAPFLNPWSPILYLRNGASSYGLLWGNKYCPSSACSLVIAHTHSWASLLEDENNVTQLCPSVYPAARHLSSSSSWCAFDFTGSPAQARRTIW